ncbi:penicillin-binding protein 1A [Bradyrhizobium liaoningense]
MRQIIPPHWKQRVRNFFLDLDARIDSSLFSSAKGIRELYERYSTFMDRFYVGRWKRWVFIEPLSEAATLGLGGLVVMLTLAIPAFRETADEDWLKKSDLAVSFLDRYGNPIGSRGIKHNDSIPLEDFPDVLIKATLATEDRRFYEHFGIDIAGTARALVTNAQAGGVRQGGSSITQQLAKNLFLSNERTIERKVNEAFLAIWLEWRLTKNEILKLYLDRAYMGGGTFGVDGAAHFYFNKSARDVTLAEAAMLAGLFKAPTKYAPHINLPAARARANVVLDNLVDAGFMTEGQVFGARRNPAFAVDRRDEASPNYYLDYAFDEMRKLVDTFPKSYTERVFVVRLAIDTNVQKAAEDAVENQLRQFGRDYHATQAATVVADLDGGIRAMVGGRDYGASQFNRATDAYRQPGSSFKPYVYTTALLNGYTPNSIVVDGPVCIGNWCPQNYGHSYSGSVTLTQAITRSINVVPVKLSIEIGRRDQPKAPNPAKIGRAKIVEVARRFGLKAPLPDTPSLPIGSDEVTVLEHAVAYATFPNRGKAVTPHAVLEVRTGAGDLVWRWDRDGPKPRQAIPASVAADMAGMMSHVVSEGTARRAALDGIPTAGKTGTTNAYRDAWFVGYTGNFTCAVWYGNDDYSPTNRMTGGSLPAQTWHDIMLAAHQGVEVREIPGIGMGQKLPPQHVSNAQANAAAKVLETKPGPPPVLTKRGADVLVRVEKLLDDAARTANKSAADDSKAAKPSSATSALAFPQNYAEEERQRLCPAQELIETRAADPDHIDGASSRNGGRRRRDLDDDDARHRDRHADHRRLDRAAAHRHRRRRPLFARHHRAQRRAADRHRRRRRLHRHHRRQEEGARRPLRCRRLRRDAAGAVLDADAV